TEGVNNTILHVYITQAYPDKVPGINAYFGTEFNRNNTWFYQGSAFIDYIRRCNYVLQQGKPVNDVAYFIGEDAPKMTGVRNPELPKGYGYDYINAEVIETRLAVKDGKLVLPDSTAYRILVLPQLETMRPQLLAKIKELVNAGAVVLGPRPKRSPSLEGYGKADRLVQDMAAEIWGKVDGVKVKYGTYGKGRVLSGLSMEEAFKLLNLRPDFYMSEAKPVLYTHRSTPESEIYFITNQSDSVVSFNPQFRTAGRQPEWWNPVNGNSRGMDEFTIGDSYTSLPVTLEAYQSGFIVFTKATGKASFASKNFPASVTAAEITSPWEVKFDKEKRGPEKAVVFDKLID
ncbi:MAG: glycoside hydrolase family 2, partial [Sphingobacteriales bacterium]